MATKLAYVPLGPQCVGLEWLRVRLVYSHTTEAPK